MKGGALLLLVVCLNCYNYAASENTLKKLQIIFRHGHRYPNSLQWTDNDTCASSYNKNQTLLGNLTALGRSQMSLLGSFLRVHYNAFIGSDPSRVQVNVSNYQRDIDSATILGKALFDYFNSSDVSLPLMSNEVDGPMATNDSYYGNWINSTPLRGHEELCAYLQDKGGMKCTSRFDVDRTADQMICEIAENCQLPSWLTESMQDQLRTFTKEVYESYRYCSNKKMIEENSDEMIKHIKEVFKPGNEKKYKDVHLYASHDTNIAMLLTRLDLFDFSPVPFGAAVFFEEHSINNTSVIRIFYDNSTDYTNFRQLKLRDCATDCPYETFVKLPRGGYNCNLAASLQASVSLLVLISSLAIFARFN